MCNRPSKLAFQTHEDMMMMTHMPGLQKIYYLHGLKVEIYIGHTTNKKREDINAA